MQWLSLDWPVWLVVPVVVVLIIVAYSFHKKGKKGAFLLLLGAALFMHFGLAWSLTDWIWIPFVILSLASGMQVINAVKNKEDEQLSSKWLSRSLRLLGLALAIYFALLTWQWAMVSWPLWAWVIAIVVACAAAIAFVRKRAWWLLAAAIVAVMALIIGAVSFGAGHGGPNDTEPSPSPSTTITTSPSPSPSPSATPSCAATWEVELADTSNNRWFYEGIAEIYDAKNEEQAREATNVWLQEVRKDPRLLAGAAQYFLHREVNVSTLQDEAGECVTDAAVVLVTELELAVAEALSVERTVVPHDAFNSGVHDGIVVGAAENGISGDRVAIKIVLKDGTVLYIMARCGNIATVKPPPVPEGPTDQPPLPRCPDGSVVPPSGLCPKVGDEDVLVNPRVPAHVQGPGTTPVGTDPGPAEDAVDTPTGRADDPSTTVDESKTDEATEKWTPAKATPAPSVPPEVQDPDPVITPTPMPTQTGDPVVTCDKDGDGIPDDSCS